MSQKVNLNKQGFEKRAYLNTIDTSFTQLVPPPPPVEEEVTVEQFFTLYNTLFYEIPAEGSIDSHRFLIERSKEYIGFTEEKDEDIQVLLDEITLLREELLSSQQEVRDLQISGSQAFAQLSGDLSEEEVTNIETQADPGAPPAGSGGGSSSGGSSGGGY